MKLWIFLGMASLALATVARASQPTTPDGQPWPTQDGKLLTGRAVILTYVAWDGTPFLGCVKQSTGNDALDRAALSAVARHQVARSAGVPKPVLATMPITMEVSDPQWPASETIALAPLPERACEPVELPAYEPAMRRRKLEAAHMINVSLGPDGLVPGVKAPWPRDRSGRPLSGSVLVNSVVDKGVLDEGMMLVDPGRAAVDNPEFVAAAARLTRKMALDDPSDPIHLANVLVRFNVPDTLNVAQLPVYAGSSPEGKEGNRMKACSVFSDLGFMISKDHRAGVSQADAVAKVKTFAHGNFSEMIDKVAGIIYSGPSVFGDDTDDRFHRTKALFYCLAVLGPPR